MKTRAPHTLRLLVGTYALADKDSIFVFDMDTQTGELTPRSALRGVANPSFLVLHPNGQTGYCVSEIGNWQGGNTGAVFAFSLSGDTPALLPRPQASEGGGPCHISLAAPSRRGGAVLVANYGGGSMASLPLASDGTLLPASATDRHHSPSKVNPQRQNAAFAHCLTPDPTGNWAIGADLGEDRLYVYRLVGEPLGLSGETPFVAPTRPGAGPRQITFSPDGRWVFVINELDSTVSSWRWQAGGATPLTPVAVESTLPPGWRGTNSGAAIATHPSGQWLYASNRGHDSIAQIAVNGATGELKLVDVTPSGGHTPRGFGLDPQGRFLVTAHQDSNTLRTLAVDERTGRLALTRYSAIVSKPVCCVFG